MPLEIRELVIKANLAADDASGPGGVPPENNQQSGDKSTIQMCVEKVLEILNERNER